MAEIDPARLMGDLRRLADFGRWQTGVHRPTYSDDDMAARAWFAARLQEAGLDTEIDGIGNVIGRSRHPGPALLLGSHIETQPHGGWLDGALGVIYGLEVARALPDRAIDVAAWADEEGHFGNFLGSRSFVGLLDEAEIDRSANKYDGGRLRDALARAGLAGRPRAALPPGRYRGYLEAHIEQGDELDRTGLRLGIVTSIVGIWQYRIRFEGVQNHAGTTRMAIRRDAGAALVQLASAIARTLPRPRRAAIGLDRGADHARAGGGQHRAGRRGDAVPVPRRRPGGAGADGARPGTPGRRGRRRRPVPGGAHRDVALDAQGDGPVASGRAGARGRGPRPGPASADAERRRA